MTVNGSTSAVPKPTSSAARYFEDFTVGQRFVTATRTVTAADLDTFTAISGDRHPLHSDPDFAAQSRFRAPILQGPFGLAVFFGMFFELGLVGESVVGLLNTNWTYRAPIYVGDTLHSEFTIIDCHATSRGGTGVVDRHVELKNQDGVVVQEGTTAFLVNARGTATTAEGLAFGTVAWGQLVCAELGRGDAFATTVASWDGTIGIRCADKEVHFRIYRGTIIEVSSRAVHGATFTVTAPAITWTELLLGDHNDFMKRAMTGQFTVSGSGYEYLRTTKPLALFVDAARVVAKGAST